MQAPPQHSPGIISAWDYPSTAWDYPVHAEPCGLTDPTADAFMAGAALASSYFGAGLAGAALASSFLGATPLGSELVCVPSQPLACASPADALVVGATLVASADFRTTPSGLELVRVPSQPLACASPSGESVESWELGNTPLLAYGRELFPEAGLEQEQPWASNSTANASALLDPLRVVPAAEDEEAPEAPESPRERRNAMLRAIR